ncbi:hypothetical protein BKA65DRAFT_2597 [Rhexocercosporidium sp. MPI-PUGE-AT-0058]|nr:hypothetical protein BKA65DRAFT_2597 [Rhexocercosporidium sp. MPI-PUGE-AT-0058]
MNPRGQGEPRWIIMNEYTVDHECQEPRSEYHDTASSEGDMTFGGSDSSSEYVTTNETSSGKDSLVSPPSSNSLPYSGSPTYGTHVLHRNGQDIQYQDAANPQARLRSGQDGASRSFDQTRAGHRSRSSPTSIDLQAQVPRTFDNFQENDLIKLFPYLVEDKPKAKVEEWVARCEHSGAGVPYIHPSTGDTQVARDRRVGYNSCEPKTQDRDDNTKYLSGVSDRPETANQQKQNKARKPNKEDEEDSKEK